MKQFHLHNKVILLRSIKTEGSFSQVGFREIVGLEKHGVMSFDC